MMRQALLPPAACFRLLLRAASAATAMMQRTSELVATLDLLFENCTKHTIRMRRMRTSKCCDNKAAVTSQAQHARI
jgi:hypothetical protein